MKLIDLNIGVLIPIVWTGLESPTIWTKKCRCERTLRDVPEERHVDLDQCQSDDFGSAQRKGMCASIIGCLLAYGEPNTVNCTVEH